MNRKLTVSPSAAPLCRPLRAWRPGGRGSCRSSRCPFQELGYMAPPTACPCSAWDHGTHSRCKGKASGAFSGPTDTQSLPGGGHSCNLDLICNLSTQQDKNILKKKKKKAFKRAFLETNLNNCHFCIPGPVFSPSLLSAGLRRKSWSVLCSQERGKGAGMRMASHRRRDPARPSAPGQPD